ncbi:perivitellin-2 67 kDa subunit-like [Physella acuta]|uniref:perivitellin-2 67 kDa subunit-like n=1 Tax=Physella acuta TaxID=109671 RepID=UPI0027DD2C0B|nr:perivitellin-2 67 kDa subunit-like [Physella acuta]
MFKQFFILFEVVTSIVGSKQCPNLPPGLTKIVKGVDISKLDLLPLEFTSDDGILSPVFPLTCEQGKKWKSPKGVIYDMPDQIWTISSVPGGYMSSEVSTFQTYSEVRDSMSVSVGLDIDYRMFSFSASSTYKKMQSLITNSSKYLSEVTAFTGATRVDVLPAGSLEFDNNTQNYIDNMLTGTYESNQQAYDTFVKEYGTHYFATGNFGGYVRMIFEATQEYFSSSSEVDIETNAKASYAHMITVSTGVSTSSAKIDESFKSGTKNTVKYYGGNTNYLNSQDGFSRWLPTVENDPWLFSGNLKPISDLIRNSTKKSSVIQAVERHLIRNYLDELQSLVNAAKKRSDNFIINNFANRINEIKSRKDVARSSVDAFSSDLSDYMNVPSWFLSNTKMCLLWSATGDENQCGGPNVQQVLCANVNKMTDWYHDETDKRSGGCKMQWAVFSSGTDAPHWLSKVQLCYQLDVSKANSLHCAILRYNINCADLNKYTYDYVDDTTNNKGGCKLRWMLQIPDEAPYWMRAMQLCFNWESEGDVAQCGGGAPLNQCVLANRWTQYYEDNTDDRAGGCKMSWGLKTS